MPQRNRNNLSNLLRAMPVKVSVKDGNVSESLGITSFKVCV